MSTTAKNEKNLSGDSPVCGKSRGNRLARRARSFKEDFLEIISQMRSPGGSTTRSGSPCSPKARTKTPDLVDGSLDKNPSKDLECNIRQAQLALKHFRDVVNKNKLEMLPGNGTVVLETVTAIHVLLKKYVLNEQSSTLVSATNQVYQSVAKLIKLCDDYLLIGEKALGKENVTEIVNLVEDAIQNLVSLTKDKIILRDPSLKLVNEATSNYLKHKPRALSEKNTLDLGQRSSLPDIPLTPREREILERTSAFVLERHAQSSENVLSDSPPPKPPHPDRVNTDSSFPPPLPPKKRQRHLDELNVIKNSMDCLSLRSKSPEDSSSLLSASAGSLDSVLNHCREEEDLTVLLDNSEDNHCIIQTNAFGQNCLENGCSHSYQWDYSSSPSIEHSTNVNSSEILVSPLPLPETLPAENSHAKSDRLSGSQAESGFSSMPSRRSSSQSYSASSQQLSSTRSSQQSYTSQESHHTEKKVTTETTSQKFQSVTVESSQNQVSSQRSVTTSTSSEKLSYQKQTFFRKCVETTSSNETFWSGGDSPSRKIEDIPCCHHEIKVQECPFHASLLSSSSPLDPFKLNKTPDHGHTSTCSEDDRPPALPEKQKKRERHPSQYDNLDDVTVTTESIHESNCSISHTVVEDDVVNHKQSSISAANAVSMNTVGGVTNISKMDKVDGAVLEAKTVGSVTEGTIQTLGISVFQSSQSPEGNPPPLPPKKKHIMAYMEMFGNASHANANEFLRHSVHAYNLLQSEWQQHQKLLTSAQSCSLSFNCDSNQTTPVRTVESKFGSRTSLPPALPPKKRTKSTTSSSPPQTPTLIFDVDAVKRDELCDTPKELQIPSSGQSATSESLSPTPTSSTKDLTPADISDTEKEGEIFLLDKLNVSEYLVLKKQDDEGPDVRGGHPDALVIHATKAHKNDFLYQEAFLTTYRTFMTPLELIQKLCYRHEMFSSSQDILKQRAARESFSLLVRVVSDLTLTDLDQVVLQTLMEFVQQLLCRGDLTMAKALRVIMLSKHEAKKLYLNSNNLLPSHNIYTRQSLLLDFKSEQIAEQMTLLDAELFLKIEIPEVLIWAQEQNEERSPNLTKFTEHFNKMSYWSQPRVSAEPGVPTQCGLPHISPRPDTLSGSDSKFPSGIKKHEAPQPRTSPCLPSKITGKNTPVIIEARSRILEQNDAKDREKYVVKFIKIMKHLRKINNFNSYLALLSALDSAPIRRLEWQKHITEGLKEYCALIDSSSSFRAYRQALAETHPPCIPYIGLVLQDLTFVHIGNTNNLPTGGINFSKRWQQFNIVENMKRFKKGSYPYKKNEKIIAFFNGFDDSLSEEAMWQISEKIKPRGGKKV